MLLIKNADYPAEVGERNLPGLFYLPHKNGAAEATPFRLRFV